MSLLNSMCSVYDLINDKSKNKSYFKENEYTHFSELVLFYRCILKPDYPNSNISQSSNHMFRFSFARENIKYTFRYVFAYFVYNMG